MKGKEKRQTSLSKGTFQGSNGGAFSITQYKQFLSCKENKKLETDFFFNCFNCFNRYLLFYNHERTFKKKIMNLGLQILPINHLIIPLGMIPISIQQSVRKTLTPAPIQMTFIELFSFLSLSKPLFCEHSVPFETILGEGGEVGFVVLRGKEKRKNLGK